MTNASDKSLFDKIQEAVAFIKTKYDKAIQVGVICGTGMGSMADKPANVVKVPYEDIPHFPVSTVESHKGFLCLAEIGGKQVATMQGRFHRYEGYTLEQVTFPVRVMKALGADDLIIMNAVGSVNPLIRRASLVLISDHINMMGDNPLIGPNDDRLGPRFPDMSEPYSFEIMDIAEKVALDKGIKLHRGVAVAVTGPNLETRAEYRAIERVGGDLVSMSTVPENIVAVHAGMRVMGLSTVTDECYPEALRAVELAEIIEVSNSLEPAREAIIEGVIAAL